MNKQNEKNEEIKEKKIIQFLGGKVSIYILTLLILIFSSIWLYNQVSYVFKPLYIIVNSMITPVIIAYIFFYVLKPVKIFLEKKLGFKDWIATIVAILVFITVIVVIFVGAIPLILEQTQHLIVSIPNYVEVVRSYLEANSNNAIIKSINEYLSTNINVSKFSSTAFSVFSGIVGSAASAISSTASLVLTVPFVLYYLLKDSNKFSKYILGYLPNKTRIGVEEIIVEIDKKVGSYISGQMLVSLCIGVMLFIGYQIIGLPYAISLATLAALLSVVPYLGPVMAIAPAMLVAAGTSWVMVLKMLVVWGVVQFLEGNFIAPNIMGKSMNQHPLTVIFVIIIAANMLGIVGAIIGIPLYAILKIIIKKIFDLIKKRYNNIYK